MMDDKETTVSSLIELVAKFRDERNWKQFHTPKDLALAMGIEVGELSELFLWKTDEEIQSKLSDLCFRQKVEEEMADIQILLLSLADILQVNMAKAVERKVQINADKYPIQKTYGIACKYTELEDSQSKTKGMC